MKLTIMNHEYSRPKTEVAINSALERVFADDLTEQEKEDLYEQLAIVASIHNMEGP